MIVCLLSSLVFINVEASDGGSSSVGIEFYQNPRTPAPKDPHRKQMRQLLIPRNQLVLRKEINEVVVRHRPPQLAQRSLVQEQESGKFEHSRLRLNRFGGNRT